MLSNIDSPLMSLNYRSANTKETNHYRYSSCDQPNPTNTSQNQCNFNATIKLQKYQRKTLQKQRTHSQKKLTLTTQNYCQQPSSYINPLQMASYLNFSKQQTLKKQGKMTLQKKGKYCSLKSSQITNNQIPMNSQKINQADRFYNNPSKQRSKALLQNPKENVNPHQNTYVKNNYRQSNNTNFASTNNNTLGYNFAQVTPSTAPNSPVYTSSNVPIIQNLFLKNDNKYCQELKKYVQQKLTKQSSQTNKIMFQQSMKIRQLESKLIKNQECLKQKNQKIQFLTKQLQNFTYFIRSQSSKFNFNGNIQSNNTLYKTFKNLESSSKYQIKSDESGQSIFSQDKSCNFISQKISDVQKKSSILSKYLDQSNCNLNQKIDQINRILNNVVNHKFLEMKLILQTFMSKTQLRVNSCLHNINLANSKYQELIKTNKASTFVSKLKTIKQRLIETFKFQNKSSIFVQDMKNTINTADHSHYSQRATQESIQATQESIQAHSEFKESSFWQNLEDVSFAVKQGQVSFTQDCFFYPGNSGNNFSIISQGKQYFTSLQSFSKLPQQKQTASSGSFNQQPAIANFYKPFLKFIKPTINNCISSQGQSQNTLKSSEYSPKSSEYSPKSSVLDTIMQIAKSRRYPIACYIDKLGSLRYKGSQSYIFDKRGNTLKPNKSQLQACIQSNWIILDDEN